MSRCLVFACLVALGCSDRSSTGPGDRPDDALDVYEAVFRYHLENYPAAARAYLSVDGKDVPADLLDRLRRDWPNLQPVSKEPKEKGRHVYVKGLKWIDRNTAEIRAGYWFPTKFAGEGGFGDHRVVRDRGRWVVEKATNQVMS